MPAKRLSFTIVGCGGIGCALGYALAAAGASVRCVEADANRLEWGRSHGLRVDRLPPLRVEFVPFGEWTGDSSSLILLCTKCYDNARVLEQIPNDVSVLPVQNGFDKAFDTRGDFPEGIASFVSECLPGQTRTRITRAGKLHLGMHRGKSNRAYHGISLEHLAELGTLLGACRLFRVEIVEDILPFKHTKLMYNAAIGPLAAALGVDNGRLLSHPPARRLFFALLAENYNILQGAGIRLEKIGPFHPDTVARILAHPVLARALSWAFYPSLQGTYCSMHGDLPTGRSEIDNYNRYLIELAGDVPCPCNRRVFEVVKRIEREHTPPSLDILDQLLPRECSMLATSRS